MKQFAIIGLGRFGMSVAKNLSDLGHEVLAIDNCEEKVNEASQFVTHAVIADALEEENLKALGLRNFDVVVVAIGEQDIQANILVTVTLKELGVKQVISRAQSDRHGKVLTKVGADKVVYPEKDMGLRLAHSLVSPNVLDFIELSPEHSITEVVTPAKFIGKSLAQLNLRAKYGITVLAIKTDIDILVAPGAQQVIRQGDILVALGKNDCLVELEEV